MKPVKPKHRRRDSKRGQFFSNRMGKKNDIRKRIAIPIKRKEGECIIRVMKGEPEECVNFPLQHKHCGNWWYW